MMYRVLNYFTDMQDGDRAYNPGDIYPREGLKPSAARIAELSGSGNRLKKPLIEAVEKPVKKRKKKGE